MSDGPLVFTFNGFKTLPIYIAVGRAQEDIPSFGKGEIKIEAANPDYEPVPFAATADWLNLAGSDAKMAVAMVSSWPSHHTQFLNFVQLKDDSDRRLIRRLHAHTELVSTLCDARIGLDASILWRAFDSISPFAIVHEEYRADLNRDEKYADYAHRLEVAWNRISETSFDVIRLIQRITKQIELKAGVWPQMPPLVVKPEDQTVKTPGPVRLFYSYSHKDEALRNELETHLSILKRNGIIEGWHDRKITAGSEWKGRIDSHLESAEVILLLVSSDFLASDYCHDIELKRAMEKHHAGTARVIPVLLRACDWEGASFGKLQGLPKDVKPITSWGNTDEAFTDIAKGIRKAVAEIRPPCPHAASQPPLH